MARAFQRFAEERQFKRLLASVQIEAAKDYAPSKDDPDYKEGSDAPWIRRFAESGGRCIISGDTDMMWEPHERLALVEAGMMVFFFSSRWSNWPFFQKCSLLMFWWPTIIKRMKQGKKGFWKIPASWSDKAKLQSVTTQNRHELKVRRQRAAQPKVAKARAKGKSSKPPEPPAQASFRFGDRS